MFNKCLTLYEKDFTSPHRCTWVYTWSIDERQKAGMSYIILKCSKNFTIPGMNDIVGQILLV